MRWFGNRVILEEYKGVAVWPYFDESDEFEENKDNRKSRKEEKETIESLDDIEMPF